MNRLLQYVNLLGVAALAVLCAFQWSANRSVNLEANSLEKTRLDLTAKAEQQAKDLKGQAADLDVFREQLSVATVSLKEAQTKLAKAELAIAQLETEREQLKTSVTNWAAAVATRDERLKEAADQLQKLAVERNEIVAKFNKLAVTHEETVTALNQRTQQYNELVTRFNNAKKTE